MKEFNFAYEKQRESITILAASTHFKAILTVRKWPTFLYNLVSRLTLPRPILREGIDDELAWPWTYLCSKPE